jgi:CHAD domain-containing protein
MQPAILILQHWNRQQKVFLKNLEVLKSGIESDAVHDLRVAVKKLRAYLNLFRLLMKKGNRHPDFSTTETFFRICGKYRDFDICLGVLRSLSESRFNPWFAWQQYLKTAMKMAGKNVVSAAKKYDPAVLPLAGEEITRCLMKKDQQGLLQDISAILQSKLNHIHALLLKNEEQPHALRKELKELYYWLSILPEGFITMPPYLKKLDKILDELGTWQDYQVALKKARRYRKDFVAKTSPEFLLYLDLETLLSAKSQQLLSHLHSRLKDLLIKLNITSNAHDMAAVNRQV